MKRIAFIVSIFFLSMPCFLSAHAQDSTNTYRGYTEVNRLILERVAQTNGFQIGQYLNETAQEPSVGDLLSLLGTYVGSDTSDSYRNGTPDSVSMLLWYIALNKLSIDIAAYCNPNFIPKGLHPLVIQDQFQAALKPVCAWPASTAQNDAVLFGLWSALVGYDAPPEEFQAWKNFFLQEPSYQTAPISTVISNMVLSALFNPYFLLVQ